MTAKPDNESRLATRLRSIVRDSMAFRLFLVCFVSIAYFHQGSGHNEAARYDTMRSILYEGRFIIDSFVYNSADVIMVDGHYYSGKAPGTFLLGFPFFALFDFVLKAFPMSAPFRDHLVCWLTHLFTVGLLGALCAPFMYWILRRRGGSERESATVALVVTLGTILFPFSTVFFSHSAAAFCAIFTFYQIFVYWQERATRAESGALKDPGWRLWLAGVASGFAISLEYPSAIATAVLFVYTLVTVDRKDRLKSVMRLATGFALGIFPMFVYNFLSFGKPFYVTYSAYATENTSFEAHRKGILGIRIALFDPSFWPIFIENLKEITYRPLRGLFYANPVLLLIFPGFAALFQRVRPRDWEALACFFMILGYVLFTASFGDSIVYWGGGASFGPRYTIIALPFVALPLLEVVKRRSWAYVFFPLAVLSVFFCLMATAIEPRTPYTPPNPIFEFYWPKFLTGDFAMNPAGVFSNALITRDSVSFNWGYFFGLPERLWLVPLGIIWVVSAWWFEKRFHGRMLIVAASVLLALTLIPLFG